MIEVELPDGTIVEFPEGTQPETMKAALQKYAASQPREPSTGMDALKSFGAGVGRGAADLVGLPGTLSDLAKKGLSRAFGLSDLPYENALGGASLKRGLSYVTGGATDYQPQTTAGEYARTAGEFLPAAAAFGGVNPSSLMQYGVVPAVTSETAGQMAKGSDYEGLARFGGALAGPAALGAVKRAVTPFPNVDPKRAAMVKALEKEGLKLTAGQKTGSNMLRYAESELGGRAYERIASQQADDFTRAVMRKIGSTADDASPEAIDDAFNMIGSKFNDLAARNNLAVDRTVTDGLQKAAQTYFDVTGKMQAAPIVGQTIKRINRVTNNGVMPGDVYKNMRSELSKQANSIRYSDPKLASALDDMVTTLDDGMERTIAATNPADVGAWKEARKTYSNLLDVAKASAASNTGEISPARLRQAIKSGKVKQRSYARGKGDFNELARAGSEIMKDMPQSGTASRATVRGLGGIMGGIAGTAATGGNVLGGVAGATAATAGPALLGRALLSKPGTKYLSNQLLTGPSYDEATNLMLAAALGRLTSQ